MKWQWCALEGAKNGREPKREKNISRYVTLFSATIEVKTFKMDTMDVILLGLFFVKNKMGLQIVINLGLIEEIMR